jgi:hypothetical protein
VETGGFEDVPGAGDVCVDVKFRLLDGRAHAGPGSEVDDGVGLFRGDDTLDGGPVAEVGSVNGRVFGEAGDVGALDGGVVEVVEVVENAEGVALGEEFFDEIGADEPGAASDENFHPRTVCGAEKSGQGKVGRRGAEARK